MRPFVLRLALVGVLGTATGTAGATRQEDSRIRHVEEGLLPPVLVHGQQHPGMRIQDRMRRWKVPGVVVAAIDGERVAWVRAYGVTEAGSNDPITEQTLFQAGSVSKPIAAMTALHLVQSGALELDEDVNARLSSWKIPRGDSLGATAVTLRMLLSHSAGINVHGFPGYAAGDTMPSLIQVL